MLKHDALMTPPVLQGVRSQLQYERDRYFKLHQQFIAAANQCELAMKRHEEDGDCCLVMIAMLDNAMKELPVEPSRD